MVRRQKQNQKKSSIATDGCMNCKSSIKANNFNLTETLNATTIGFHWKIL